MVRYYSKAVNLYKQLVGRYDKVIKKNKILVCSLYICRSKKVVNQYRKLVGRNNKEVNQYRKLVGRYNKEIYQYRKLVGRCNKEIYQYRKLVGRYNKEINQYRKLVGRYNKVMCINTMKTCFFRNVSIFIFHPLKLTPHQLVLRWIKNLRLKNLRTLHKT